MERRQFLISTGIGAVGALSSWPATAFLSGSNEKGDTTPMTGRPLPTWFDNAKLGIFIHWGPYSVPAWAPPFCAGSHGQCDKRTAHTDPATFDGVIPYSEWYLNALRIPGSPTRVHHDATYGADYDYYNFAKRFDTDVQRWSADSWASLFSDIGARYVVLTTKHHDGFRLWPSAIPNPVAPSLPLTATRDLVGELSSAVRSRGMKMGLYHSGGIDWTFTKAPVRSAADFMRPGGAIPVGQAYADYCDAQWRELIDRYHPSVLWNDIGYPREGQVGRVIDHFYETVPDGVINDRFRTAHPDYITPEYAVKSEITAQKWETCRGIGASFAYSQLETDDDMLPNEDLIRYFVDIVSKNGNLLLNVGPRADGFIPDIQLSRLKALGAWLRRNGTAIFDTRPWIRAADKGSDGTEVRYTQDDKHLFVHVFVAGRGRLVTLPGIQLADAATVELVGSKNRLDWRGDNRGVTITLPPTGRDAVPVVKLPLPVNV